MRRRRIRKCKYEDKLGKVGSIGSDGAGEIEKKVLARLARKGQKLPSKAAAQFKLRDGLARCCDPLSACLRH